MFLVLKDFLTLGFFVYFDDLAVEASTDCEDDYVQVSTVQYSTVQYSTG